MCGIRGSTRGKDTLSNLDEVGSSSLRKNGFIKSVLSHNLSQMIYSDEVQEGKNTSTKSIIANSREEEMSLR